MKREVTLWQALLFALLVAIGGAGIGRSCPRQSAPALEAQRELAADHTEKIQAESKATRRAARARVDQEVQSAARDSDLVEYTNSRPAR